MFECNSNMKSYLFRLRKLLKHVFNHDYFDNHTSLIYLFYRKLSKSINYNYAGIK